MGLMDYVEDLYASLTWQEVEAEAPEKSDDSEESSEEGEESKGESKEGESEESSEGGEGEDGGDDKEEEEEEEGEEEEEEEDEPEDPKPQLEAECMKTAACAPLKHHYDECAARVQRQEEEQGKAQEDCVEEYFHMMHCAAQCAAPKLFKQLR